MQAEEIRKYQDRIEHTPGDVAAYEALERLYTRGEDWSALVGLYRRKAESAAEVGERRLLWQKIARVAEEMLDDPDVAIESGRAVLTAEALDRATLRVIEGLCRRHKRWGDLRHFLGLVASSDDRAEALQALHRLGELYRVELADAGEALATYGKLLELNPRHPEGLLAAQKLLDDDDLRAGASATLETAYRASSDWDKLFKLLDKLLDTDVMEDDERAALLQRRAALVEERRGPEAAFPEFAKAFLESRHPSLRGDLERIASRAGLWRDLLQAYLRALEGSKGDEADNAILQRAAEIAEDNLGLKAVAEKCYRQLLDFDLGNPIALAALERLYVESGDDAQLLGILELRIDLGPENDALLALYARAGDIAEHRLLRIPAAIEKYEALLNVAPGHADARDALLRLYPRAGRWTDMVAHLLAHATPSDLIEVRRRVAEIYETQLGDVPKAIDQLVEVRNLLPGDARALASLTRLYERGGKHSSLLEVLEERSKHAGTPAERWQLRLRMAQVLHKGLRRPLDAADEYGAILAEAGGEREGDEARRALEDMLGKGAPRARAATLLETHYTTTKSWQRLVDFYERTLSELPGAAERARTLEAIAYVYEHQLQSPERAFWSYGRALKERPASPFAERELLRMASELSFQDQLAGLLEDALDTLFGAHPADPSDKGTEAGGSSAAARARRTDDDDSETTNVVSEHEILEAAELEEAEIEELYADDDAQGGDALVAGDEPHEPGKGDDQAPAIELVLSALLGSSADALQQRLGEEKETTAFRFCLRLATLNEETLDRPEAAATWYRRVRDFQPHDEAALCALDRLATARGDQAELRDVLRARVEAAKTPAGTAALRLRLGGLLETAFEDAAGAIDEYRAALDATPEDSAPFEALETTLRRGGRAGALADLYREALDRGSSRALSLKLAALLKDTLDDPEEALEVLRPLVVKDNRDEEALRAFESSALLAGYDKDQRAKELLPVLESLRDLAATDSARYERERRIGELLETALGKKAEAAERYAKVLQSDPDDALARAALERLTRERATLEVGAAVLEPYYRQRQEWQALIGLLELRLGAADGGKNKAALYAEIARISEERAGNPDEGFDAYARALGEEPSSATYLEAVDRLAGELGRFEELCEILDTAAAARERDGASAKDRVFVLQRLAEVAATSLGDRERAVEAYNRALSIDPDNLVVFRALEELYAHVERWRDLAELFRSALLRDPQNRTYALRLADLLEVILESPEEALDVLRAMLERNPRDPEALRAFEGVFTRAGIDKTKRAGELIPVLEALREQTDGAAQKRAYEFRVAEVLEQSLGKPDDSVPRYGSVLVEDTAHAGALLALERLSLRASSRVAACALLEAHYRKTRAFAPLAEILTRCLEDVTGSAERAALFAEIGSLREERLDDKASAFIAYSHAFEERPDSEAHFSATTRLGSELEQHEEVAFLLEAASDALAKPGATGASAHRVAVLVFLGELYRDTLVDIPAGIKAFERAHVLEPARMPVFVALEALYSREGRHSELAELYRGQMAREAGDRETGLKLARVLDDVLTQPALALDVLRALLRRDERDPLVLEAFDRVFVASSADEGDGAAELLPILLRLRDAASGPAAREYEFRAGALRELQLGELEEAVPHYTAVLNADHAHKGARVALERLLKDDVVRPAVYGVLDPFYRGEEAWQPLLALLELRQGDAKKPKEKAKILAEIGSIAEERLSDRAAAFGAYSRAFEARPEDQALLDAVSRLAGDEGKFEELVELLSQASLALGDEKRKASAVYRVVVLQKLASTASKVLGDNERAIDALTRALDLDAENDVTLTGLDKLFAQEGRARDLAAIIEREIDRAEAAPKVYDRIDLLRRLARLREEVFGDLDGAVTSYEDLRGRAPGDAEARLSLERLYEATGRWQALADLVLESTPKTKAGAPRLLRAAVLLEDHVGDLLGAREVFAQLRDLDPSDLDALRGLMRVLSRPDLEVDGRERDLLGVFEALRGHTEDDRLRADYLHREGSLLASGLLQPEEAAERFTKALELVPGHREALLALEGLAQRAEVRDAAVVKLEGHYQRVGAWQALVELYETLLPSASRPRRRELLTKMASIYETELRNPRLAFHEYSRLFREAPEEKDTLDVLERLAQEMGSVERLANLYDELLKDIPDQALGLHLTLRLARLYDESLSRRALAIDRYHFALQLDPDNTGALDALDRIYTSTEDWTHLQRILARKIELSAEDPRKVELLGRMGTLYESKLGFAGAAVDAFEAALGISPGDEASVAALERIFAQRDDLVLRQHIADTLRPVYSERGEQRRLAALDLGIAEALPADERERFLTDAAKIHEGLGEPDRAFRILVQGLLEGCLDDNLLAGLERLAHVTGSWQELCRAVDQAAQELPEEHPVREALTLRSAKWYWDRLANPSTAEQRYAWVFLRDPAASPAFRALEAIHTAVFDADKLLDLYRRRLAVVRAKDERATLLKRAGDLSADFLQRPDDALLAYEEALRMRPDDPEILESLVPLYERTRRFVDLCRVLGRQLERAVNPEEQFVLRRRLAEVFGAELGDDGEAIGHYRAALEIVPTDLELWRALRWHCARAKRGADLAVALRKELDLTTVPAERVAVARELAQVEEGEGRQSESADALRVVLDLDPADVVSAGRYELLLEKVARYADLAAFYDQRLPYVSEQERVRMLGQLGSIAEKHLGDQLRAAKALEQLCELRPADLASLRELARIYDEQGRWKECFEFLKAQVKRAGETGEVAGELLCRMGLLCEERAKNIDVAEKCYQRALAIDSKSKLALDGLRRVYQHRGDPARVVQVIERLELLVTGEERATLAAERGVILRDQVQDAEGAVAAFESALASSPLHADAAVALVDLADRGTGKDRVLANLDTLVDVFSKTRRIRDRHLLLHKLGMLAEESSQPAAAIGAFEAGYHAASTHLPTLLSLARLYYDAGHWEKALKMLQILLLNEGSLPTPADRVDLFHRLGAIRHKLGERARAINMYQRALEIDPNHGPSKKAMQDLLAVAS